MKGKKMTVKERLEKLERDKNERRKIFKELCDHVSEGLSIESFAGLSDRHFYRLAKMYPDDFDEEELYMAKQRGRDYWERIGQRQANGSCLGNSRTWYYNMANRYGWREKLEVEAEHKGSVNVNVVSYASQQARRMDENKEQP